MVAAPYLLYAALFVHAVTSSTWHLDHVDNCTYVSIAGFGYLAGQQYCQSWYKQGYSGYLTCHNQSDVAVFHRFNDSTNCTGSSVEQNPVSIYEPMDQNYTCSQRNHSCSILWIHILSVNSSISQSECVEEATSDPDVRYALLADQCINPSDLQCERNNSNDEVNWNTTEVPVITTTETLDILIDPECQALVSNVSDTGAGYNATTSQCVTTPACDQSIAPSVAPSIETLALTEVSASQTEVIASNGTTSLDKQEDDGDEDILSELEGWSDTQWIIVSVVGGLMLIYGSALVVFCCISRRKLKKRIEESKKIEFPIPIYR